MYSHPDPVIHRQLPIIAKIIQDETWLEGERRGSPVSDQDPAVRENVCRVILRVGHELRQTATTEATAPPGDSGPDTQIRAA